MSDEPETVEASRVYLSDGFRNTDAGNAQRFHMTHFVDGAQIDTANTTYQTNPQRIVVGAETDGTPLVDMDIAVGWSWWCCG